MSEPNVIDALQNVMRDLPGIAKALDSSQGYRYRGIEQITVEAQPLLALHRVLFTPCVDSYEIKDITVNNKPWTDTILTVRYRVYGPGGREDFIDIGPLIGIGRDNSDKGANKAMTQAYKYAMLQAFCIADAKDDGDQASHEADAARPEPTPAQRARAAFASRVNETDASLRRAFLAWNKEQGFPGPAELTDEQLRLVNEWMDFAESEREQAAEAERLAAEAVRMGVAGPREAAEKSQEAPEPAGPPTNAEGLPCEADDADVARADAAAKYVKALSPVEILVEYGKRNVVAPRTVTEQRSRLADILFEDPDWTPEEAS